MPPTQNHADKEEALTLRVGPVEIDIPESLGYFGGAWLAVSLELIAPPIGVLIAAIPFIRMLDIPQLPLPVTFFGHVVEGAAKPLGSDADGTIRIAGNENE